VAAQAAASAMEPMRLSTEVMAPSVIQLCRLDIRAFVGGRRLIF
jgi:hypothetical protein